MQHTSWIRALCAVLAAASALGLIGCASMEPEQCRAADWFRTGRDDGQQGNNPNRIAAYAEDCGKVGIRPDALRYRQGWDLGIPAFCTARSGWRAGTEGQSDKRDVCRGQAGEPAFTRYYDAGRNVYETKEKMRSNSNEVSRLERQLEKSSSDSEKRNIRDRLRRLDREQSDLRFELGRREGYGP